MDDAAIAVLAEWLCDNCTENFIVMKQTTETVAGGTNNPRARWERRKAGRSSFSDMFTSTIRFKIRMHREDITAFRLTWIL